jgi:GDP-4-dehydro-6-deoxy-D-mannose reductase
VRALVTGITGFAGGYLAQILLERGDEVFGVARHTNTDLAHLRQGVTLISADLRDPTAVRTLLDDIEPEAIYHLAGQAAVPAAWNDPWATMESNIRPQLNILQTMARQQSPTRLLVVTSNQVYGHIQSDQLPVNEETPLRPDNPYGVSKVGQDMLGLQYYLSHSLDILRVRAFNHIGPRQSPDFVSASFAKQIAQIEAGLSEPTIHVGSLTVRRDFTDVRDVTRAYTLLIDHGEAGEVYNVGTGQAFSIRYLLDVLLSYSQINIKIEQDPDRVRPADVPVIYADNRKLIARTGWQPRFKFEDSLRNVLNYWREAVNKDR